MVPPRVGPLPRSPPQEYLVVIPTYQRWKPVNEISSERKYKNDKRPFILVKTLAFLEQQKIEPCRVVLWTAPGEKSAYKAALQSTMWEHVEIRVGVQGIRAQRVQIAKSYREGTYIVSLDDDLERINWCHSPKKCMPLPEACFENLIFHAFGLMKEHKSFIWGLNASSNPNSMPIDGVSRRCGEINGFCYGFINRHDDRLWPAVDDVIEDAERSARYYHVDNVILRYRFLCGVTRCFKERGGLQAEFEGSTLKALNQARKQRELKAAAQLRKLFPNLLQGVKEVSESSGRARSSATLSVKFRSIGPKHAILINDAAELRRMQEGMAQHLRPVAAPSAAEASRPPSVKRKWDPSIFPNFHRQAGFSFFEVVEVAEDPIESLTPTSPAEPLAEDQALDGPPELEEQAAMSRCKSEMEDEEPENGEVARTDPYLDLYPYEDVVIIVSDDEDSGAEELETAIQESLRTGPMEEPPLPSAAEPSHQEGPPTLPATAEGSQQASPLRPSRPVLRLDARPMAAPSTGPRTSEDSLMRTRSTSSSTSRPDPLEVDPETIWRSGGESALQMHGWRRVPSRSFPGRSGAVRTDSGKEDRQLQTAIAASLRAGATAAAQGSPEDAEFDRAIAMSLATAEQEEQHRQLAGPPSSAEADQQQSQESSSQSWWQASDELVSVLMEMGFEAEDASQALMASDNDIDIALGRLVPDP